MSGDPVTQLGGTILPPGWQVAAPAWAIAGPWPFDPGLGLEVRHKIIPDLWPLAVPLDTLTPLPKNPRRGDVEAMRGSLRTYGQRKPVVVNVETEQAVIEAGNTTRAAAAREGWTHLAIVRVRDDPTTETGYAVADNRMGQLGSFDLALLADATSRLQAADPSLLLASGYDAEAYAQLQAEAWPAFLPDDGEQPRLDQREPITCPSCGHRWRIGPSGEAIPV